MNGSRSPDRFSAQAGFHFPAPGPGCGLERGTRRARAGRGLFLRLGPHGGLRRGEESESERAAGRFRLRAVSRQARERNSARAGRGLFSNFGPDYTVNSRVCYLFVVQNCFEFEFNSLIKFEPTG